MNPDIPVQSGGAGTGEGGFGGAGVVGGVITGLVGLYDSYQSNKTARENTDKTIAANSAEAQKAYERDVAFWNMQNAYNSPAAQMARYQAAGLNPHMVGQSGTGSGNASQMVKYNPPNQQYAYQPTRYGAALQQILPMVMQVGQWMQSMKMSEEAIKGQQLKNLFTATQDRKQQIAIDYLLKSNPKLLDKLDRQNSLIGYQGDIASEEALKRYYATQEAYLRIREQYGEEASQRSTAKLGGLAAQRLAQAGYKTDSMEAKSRIDKATASYTDYSITNPQSLINLVVGSALSMATGSAVRIGQGKMKAKEASKERIHRENMKTKRTITTKRGNTTTTEYDY